MSQQVIFLGTVPNDGTGTPLDTALGYCNANFTELYGGGSNGGTGSPEGVVTGNPGKFYVDVTTPSSPKVYVKTSGSGNTGWVLIIT